VISFSNRREFLQAFVAAGVAATLPAISIAEELLHSPKPNEDLFRKLSDFGTPYSLALSEILDKKLATVSLYGFENPMYAPKFVLHHEGITRENGVIKERLEENLFKEYQVANILHSQGFDRFGFDKLEYWKPTGVKVEGTWNIYFDDAKSTDVILNFPDKSAYFEKLKQLAEERKDFIFARTLGLSSAKGLYATGVNDYGLYLRYSKNHPAESEEAKTLGSHLMTEVGVFMFNSQTISSIYRLKPHNTSLIILECGSDTSTNKLADAPSNLK
jgi:hypothetical protein